MLQIPKHNFSILRKIFPVSPGPQTPSFFIDRRLGEAFLDNPENPLWGLIHHGDDMVIGGSRITDELVRFLADYSFSGLLEIESDLSGLVEECFPGAIEWERVAYISKNSPKITLPESITVRMLNASDAEQLSTIDEKWIWKYFGDPQGLIENMPAAGCFMDGELVSVSSVFTESSEYSDIAAATKNTHQGKNFGTSCAAFLSEFIIREQHKRIAWNTSPDNPPSVRIAEKLGFEKYELRTKLYKINWNPA